MKKSIAIAKRNSYIYPLVGLKAIALLLIFCWHAPLRRPFFDLGAQMCHLLFIVSGFLIGYNALQRGINKNPTWHDSISYFWKKYKQVWPLHAICAIIALLLLTPIPFSGENLIRSGFNIFLFQAWLPGSANYFSLNGATWFLSALLFCYFLSPLLCRTLARKNRGIVITFFIVTTIFIALEAIKSCYGAKFFAISLHTFPPFRALEFYLGILLAPLAIYSKNKIAKIARKKRLLIASILEISSLALLVVGVVFLEKHVLGSVSALFYMPLILTMAIDEGVISKLLGTKPFRAFGSIQFSFYILHQLIISLFAKYCTVHFTSKLEKTLIIFAVTILLAIIYSHILAPLAQKVSAKVHTKNRRRP